MGEGKERMTEQEEVELGGSQHKVLIKTTRQQKVNRIPDMEIKAQIHTVFIHALPNPLKPVSPLLSHF